MLSDLLFMDASSSPNCTVCKKCLFVKCAGPFMKGRGVGASGVGRTRFLLLQHRKATAKGPGKTLAMLQKKKVSKYPFSFFSISLVPLSSILSELFSTLILVSVFD